MENGDCETAQFTLQCGAILGLWVREAARWHAWPAPPSPLPPAAASERDRSSSDWQPPRAGKRCSAAYTVLADEDSENHHMLCLPPTLFFVHKPFEPPRLQLERISRCTSPLSLRL